MKPSFVLLTAGLMLLTVASSSAQPNPGVQPSASPADPGHEVSEQARALATAGLVDIEVVAPSIRVDIKYATEDNFTKRKLYASAKCFLRRPVAEALAKANQALANEGVRLVALDCYRPFSVQKLMWAILPNSKFVARPVERHGKPFKGSRHNRGAAVDVTLLRLDGTPP